MAPRHILVLHGPALAFVAQPPFAELERGLSDKAKALGLELKSFRSNGEAGLLDALEANAAWADAAVVNPSSIAPIAFGLADALEAWGKPFIEVQLERGAGSRGPSALASLAQRTVVGAEAYVQALDALVSPAPAATGGRVSHARPGGAPRLPKTLGRRAAAASTGAEVHSGKTLGRKETAVADARPASGKVGTAAGGGGGGGGAGGITRAALRARIAECLAGQLTRERLSLWSREQWQTLQWGGPAEVGHRALLEETLMLLAASTKHADAALLGFMASLDDGTPLGVRPGKS